jgi:hypothetical protein
VADSLAEAGVLPEVSVLLDDGAGLDFDSSAAEGAVDAADDSGDGDDSLALRGA